MAKTIEFTADELSALKAFYSNQFEETKDRLRIIESILKKIGTVPQKRGRKPSSVINKVDSEMKAALEILSPMPAKKRGRPAKPKAEQSSSKRRGRPSKTKEETTVVSATKKRGRPAKDTKPVVTKRRGRPAKAKVESEISNAPKRRGRPAKSNVDANVAVIQKRRGRPAKVKIENSVSLSPKGFEKPASSKADKIVSTVPKRRGRPAKLTTKKPVSVVPKRRGRPAKAKIETLVSATPPKPKEVIDSNLKADSNSPTLSKRAGRSVKTKIAKNSSSKKEVIPSKVETTTSELVNPKVKKGSVKSKKVATKANVSKAKKVKPESLVTPKGVTKKKISEKIDVAPIELKQSKEIAAKIEALEKKVQDAKAKVQSSKSSLKKKPAPLKAAKPSEEKGKLTYNNFILDLLAKEERFLSTPEINESAFNSYRTKETEKKKIRSTLQTTLHRLEADNLIQLRKKENDRLSYWAIPSVSDYGFLK